MKTIIEYIEDGIQKAGSHAALGREIGVSQQQVTRCLHGPYAPSTQVARKLARFLGEKETVVVMAAEAARAPDKETKRFWERLGEQLATTAALLLVLGGVAHSGTDENKVTQIDNFGGKGGIRTHVTA